jgi:hypothetical protein
MTVKEKFANIWLVTMVLTYGGYFAAIVLLGETDFMTQIWLFSATAFAQMIILGVSNAFGLFQKSKGLRSDERDRLIEQRATHIAYNILIFGFVVVGCLMPFSDTGWKQFQAGVFFIALSEIVRHGVIVHMYRQGWHA